MLEAIQNMIYVNSAQSDILVVNYGNLNNTWNHSMKIVLMRHGMSKIDRNLRLPLKFF